MNQILTSTLSLLFECLFWFFKTRIELNFFLFRIWFSLIFASLACDKKSLKSIFVSGGIYETRLPKDSGTCI